MREAIETCYEDFAVGEVLETSRLTVTESHLVAWANLTGDWHPLHMDAEFAGTESPFGARVAHGPYVFALSVGLVEKAGVLGRSVVAWLGTDELRSLLPVFIGDTLRVRVTVLGTRLSQSDPSRGIVRFSYETLNQAGAVVMTSRYNVMIRAREGAHVS